MYPELFRIPYFDHPVSSFGVMMALGFLAAYWITAVRMEEEGQDVEIAASMLLWIMIGGVGGSKLYFAVDNWLRTDTPFATLFFNRAGITWYGGLIGGAIAGMLGTRYYGISMRIFANCVAVGCAVGQALGRIGCFLVGDDYGKVTDVPWGIAFPQGLPPTIDPVHPTQLYEMTWLFIVAAVLWRRRKTSPFLFGEYLAANGAGRIVIEHWRVNPVIAGMTEPQWIGLALVLIGGGLWFSMRGTERRATS